VVGAVFFLSAEVLVSIPRQSTGGRRRRTLAAIGFLMLQLLVMRELHWVVEEVLNQVLEVRSVV
jgi:hypothetical protein